MWFFYACCRCSMRSFLPGQPRSDISQNLCPATQCTHAAACSMCTTFVYLLANPATQCTHAAACSMRTLCSWAKILRIITSRLARQKIWRNYACCTCSMHRKTTSLTVLPVLCDKKCKNLAFKVIFLCVKNPLRFSWGFFLYTPISIQKHSFCY